MNRISVCLLSGGVDSTVAATLAAKKEDASVHLLSIFYGQGAEEAERTVASLVADRLISTFPNVLEHFILELQGRVRRNRSPNADQHSSRGFVGWRSPQRGWEKAGYPSTRDEVFTLIAAAGAEARLRDCPSASEAEVIIATNADDLANFDDLKPSNFLENLQGVLDGKLMPASGRPVRISLPLIGLTKKEVVALGFEIGAPLDLTWSCYFGMPNKPCGNCDQCRWRADAFAALGKVDPALCAQDRLARESEGSN